MSETPQVFFTGQSSARKQSRLRTLLTGNVVGATLLAVGIWLIPSDDSPLAMFLSGGGFLIVVVFVAALWGWITNSVSTVTIDTAGVTIHGQLNEWGKIVAIRFCNHPFGNLGLVRIWFGKDRGIGHSGIVDELFTQAEMTRLTTELQGYFILRGWQITCEIAQT